MGRTARQVKRVGALALLAIGFLAACGGDPEPSHTFATYTPAPSPTPEETPSIDKATFEEAKTLATELAVAITMATNADGGGYIPDEVYTHTAEPYQSWLVQDLIDHPRRDDTVTEIYTDKIEYFAGYDPENITYDFILIMCIPPDASTGYVSDPNVEAKPRFAYDTIVFQKQADEALRIVGLDSREVTSCEEPS